MLAWPFTKRSKPVDKAPEYVSRRATEFFQAPLRSGANLEVSLSQYGNVSTLFAVVSRLANSTAAVDWTLYRKSADGRRVYEGVENRKSVTKHAALSILNKPNEFMTRQEFFEVIQQSIDLTGEGWIMVERSQFGNMPIGLWPLRSDRMSVIKSADEFLTGYIYKTPDGKNMPIAKEDIIFIRMPHPLDPYRGLGPVQALMVDLEAARFASEYNRNFFLNSAIPGGTITVPESLDDDDFNQLVDRWREQNQGVSNAHRVTVLENGADFKPVFYTMRDMLFTELRQLSRDTIMEAFAFPKFMLGLVDDVNKANAIASKAMYNEECVTPRLERIKAALNADFLPLFGATDLEFDFTVPQIQDPDTDASAFQLRAQAVVALVQAGYDSEQALMAAGLPPMDFSKPKPPPALPAPGQQPNDAPGKEASDGNSLVQGDESGKQGS